jgi:serine/threonine-protein kinase
VSRAITRPACDESFVVFVGSAITPPAAIYRTDVQKLLDTYPGSEYLRTSDTCSSLRPYTGAGDPIYGVYYGPFGSQDEACQVRNTQGGDSYVRILDTVTPPGQTISC